MGKVVGSKSRDATLQEVSNVPLFSRCICSNAPQWSLLLEENWELPELHFCHLASGGRQSRLQQKTNKTWPRVLSQVVGVAAV